MLIAIVIIAYMAVYRWQMGYIDGEKTPKFVIMSIVNDPTDTDLLVYVLPFGNETVQIDETGCLYVDEVLVDCTISGVAVSESVATINRGEIAVLRYSGGAVLPEVKLRIKVTAVSGDSAERSVYPASTYPIDGFIFGKVKSTQTSGRPFNITIWAVDEHDNIFPGYTGANTLTISGGEISPLTTGNFVNGIWSGAVTVTGSVTDATITTVAQSNSSLTGTSSTFKVTTVEPTTLWNRTYGGRSHGATSA